MSTRENKRLIARAPLIIGLSSTSTLVLPRALASRASDVSKRLKHSILQLIII